MMDTWKRRDPGIMVMAPSAQKGVRRDPKFPPTLAVTRGEELSQSSPAQGSPRVKVQQQAHLQPQPGRWRSVSVCMGRCWRESTKRGEAALHHIHQRSGTDRSSENRG